MRTPGVLDFFQKKKFQVRAELKVAKIYVVFQQKLFNSQSLSLPSSLYRHSHSILSLSHILTLPGMMRSEIRFGLVSTENQWVL